jgi:hypothetical protein
MDHREVLDAKEKANRNVNGRDASDQIGGPANCLFRITARSQRIRIQFRRFRQEIR